LSAGRRRCGALCAAALALPAAAFESALEFGVQSHRLREKSASGATLVTERGVAPLLAARLAHPLASDWSLRAAVSGWATRARYDGQTQGGSAVESRTDSEALVLEGALRRSLAPNAWIEGGVQVERFRRHIIGAGGASGLDERLTQPRWLLAAGWSDSTWSVALGARSGDRSRLDVRFDDGVFDRVRLASGRARGWSLQAGRAVGGDWSIAAGLDVLSIGASSTEPLVRGARVAGTVTQPRWRCQSVSVGVQRVWR